MTSRHGDIAAAEEVAGDGVGGAEAHDGVVGARGVEGGVGGERGEEYIDVTLKCGVGWVCGVVVAVMAIVNGSCESLLCQEEGEKKGGKGKKMRDFEEKHGGKIIMVVITTAE